ncbi:hypothetical protein ACP6NG_10945 [Brevibacterium casei]|uniref:hypothetical protein n=1 Tax=Brevibacterium casei TaxID=33889 RepID=UPI003F7DE46D
MPTFSDPSADAEEAQQALRGLAHASRTIENPDDLYGIVGQLRGAARSLEQSVAQLAQSCLAYQARAAHDDGDRELGSADAWAAADTLRRAAQQIGRAEQTLDEASGHLGRIAWQPPQKRWVTVVFLQGEDADRMLERIEQDGTDAVIEELRGFDHGEETTRAAESKGHVTENLQTGMSEQQAASGEYTLTYSHSFGHVALYRQESVPAPEPGYGVAVAYPTRADIAAMRNRDAQARLEERRTRVRGDGSWFTPDRITDIKRNRGLRR